MLKALAQRRRRGLALATFAVVFSLAVALYLSSSCFYRSESRSASVDGTGMVTEVVARSCESMWASSPIGTLAFNGVPLSLGVIGLLGAITRRQLPQLVAGSMILFLGYVASVLTFGWFPMYYAPAGIALLISRGSER